MAIADSIVALRRNCDDQTRGVQDVAFEDAPQFAPVSLLQSQSGVDPGRASDIMIQLTQQAKAPRHLVLGAFGFDAVTKVLKDRLDEIQAQRELTLSADFPK